MSKNELIAKLNENIDDLTDVDLEIELMERMKWILSYFLSNWLYMN